MFTHTKKVPSGVVCSDLLAKCWITHVGTLASHRIYGKEQEEEGVLTLY